MGGRKLRLAVHRKNEERKKLRKKTVHQTVKSATPTVSACVTSPPVPSTLPVILPITAFTTGQVESVSQLARRISAFPSQPCSWSIASINPLVVCKLQLQSVEAVNAAAVTVSISISNELHWTVSYMTKEVDATKCPVFADFPVKLNSVALVHQIIELIDSMAVCVGNPDDKFLNLWDHRTHTLFHSSGSQSSHAGYLDINSHASTPTLRSNNCQVFLAPNKRSNTIRCSACSNYRSLLIVQCQRLNSKSSQDCSAHSSHINYRYQTIPELITRLDDLKREYCNVKKCCQRLREKITASCELNGVEVDDETHADLKDIATQHTTTFINDMPSDSLKRIFWEQQIEAMSKKDARSMRWHPLMIRWCLHLRNRSSGAYEALRNSGCLCLPSQRTLRDYTHYVEAACGFSTEVDKMLMSASRVDSCPAREKCVIMLLDEMHIRDDLVFDKHSGALIGFCNLGEITMHLLRFESEMNDEKPANLSLAKSMMVFMIRGLFNSLQFPYAQFPCTDISGDMLFEPFWEAVCRVEKCGLKVLAATLDGNSANRRLIKMHNPAEEVLHKVVNPYAEDNRYLYFFSDPPHLLKTIRNCWQSKSRNLWCNGKHVSWSHLVSLYDRDVAPGKGIRLIRKIKKEHITLTSFSKMRVDLAVQVLSNSVSKALDLVGGEEASETARFVGMVDKFFDALNVHNYYHETHSRKDFQKPYTEGTDSRLKWLEEDFLGYFEQWEHSVRKREGFTKTELGLMLISQPTRLGMKMTCKSFVELVRYLFTLPDVKSFLSQRICQDPLERFFGVQRQRGCVNDNPNVQEFTKNTQALRVVNLVAPAPLRGNCRGSKLDTSLDKENINEPLPKRSRKK